MGQIILARESYNSEINVIVEGLRFKESHILKILS
jgi:hypothetical protein